MASKPFTFFRFNRNYGSVSTESTVSTETTAGIENIVSTENTVNIDNTVGIETIVVSMESTVGTHMKAM